MYCILAWVGNQVATMGEYPASRVWLTGEYFDRNIIGSIMAGWWFGMRFIFSFSWEFHHPNWRIHISQSGRLKPPTRLELFEDWSTLKRMSSLPCFTRHWFIELDAVLLTKGQTDSYLSILHLKSFWNLSMKDHEGIFAFTHVYITTYSL